MTFQVLWTMWVINILKNYTRTDIHIPNRAAKCYIEIPNRTAKNDVHIPNSASQMRHMCPKIDVKAMHKAYIKNIKNS